MNAPVSLDLPLDGNTCVPCSGRCDAVAVQGETALRLPPVPITAIGLANPDAIESIALLRARHFAKGHTPETDSAHGPSHFWHGVHEFYWKAMNARDPEQRRKNLIAAAAMIVAQIDADTFLQQKAADDAQG
jgi:hypothetical protein